MLFSEGMTTANKTSDKVEKVVLITGASRGIGKQLAFECARRGFRTLLCSRNAELLEANCAAINELGGNARFITCDVTNDEELNRAITFTLDTFGRIDIAILNAGIGGSNNFSDFDQGSFDKVFATNVTSVIHGLNLLIPVMKRQGSGTIACICSLADTRAIPGNGPYIASKSAIHILLEAATIELKPLGINVVTVRPGFIDTDLNSQNKTWMPMLMKSERAAKIIVNGILKNRPNISFPLPMAFVSAISRIIPPFIWRFIFRVK